MQIRRLTAFIAVLLYLHFLPASANGLPLAPIYSSVLIGGGFPLEFQPSAINNFGQIVGTTLNHTTGVRDVGLWTPIARNSPTGNFSFLNFEGSVADFNDRGEVLLNRNGRGYLWSPAAPNGAIGTAVSLPTLPIFGGVSQQAVSMNSSGDVLFTEYNQDATQGVAFLLKREGPSSGIYRLPTPVNHLQAGAIDVSDTGQILAWSRESSVTADNTAYYQISPTAFAASTFIVQLLPFTPHAINSNGTILGNGAAPFLARWQNGTLEYESISVPLFGFAGTALNDNDWAVGAGFSGPQCCQASALYAPGLGLIDTNFSNGFYVDINDLGQIAVYLGYNRAYLLTPSTLVPEPGIWIMFLFGSLAIAIKKRRLKEQVPIAERMRA